MQDGLVNQIMERITDGKLTDPVAIADLQGKIQTLEDFLLTLPQTEIPLKHTFSDGVYAREITIPKGALIVGKIHKKRNMNIISRGKVSFFSTDGAIHCEGPHTFVASPGVKRVIYAHEETVWTTIHGTEETDLDKIEEIFIAKTYAELGPGKLEGV